MLSPTKRLWRIPVLLVAGVAALASGCAAITGLDQFSKGGDDASSDASIFDQTVGDTRPPDSTVGDSSGLDSSSDTSNPGDAGTDAFPDGDAGCGPVNTVTNCSQCGSKCDPLNADDASCTGTTCQYACKTGFSNCDASAPDLGGCECPTPTCCGASCATTHNNGVGQSFYDCVAKGTYTQMQAGKACTAYTGNQFSCSAANCLSDAGDSVVCGAADSGSCVCWNYVGNNISHVYKSGSGTCFCPGSSDPTWD